MSTPRVNKKRSATSSQSNPSAESTDPDLLTKRSISEDPFETKRKRSLRIAREQKNLVIADLTYHKQPKIIPGAIVEEETETQTWYHLRKSMKVRKDKLKRLYQQYNSIRDNQGPSIDGTATPRIPTDLLEELEFWETAPSDELIELAINPEYRGHNTPKTVQEERELITLDQEFLDLCDWNWQSWATFSTDDGERYAYPRLDVGDRYYPLGRPEVIEIVDNDIDEYDRDIDDNPPTNDVSTGTPEASEVSGNEHEERDDDTVIIKPQSQAQKTRRVEIKDTVEIGDHYHSESEESYDPSSYEEDSFDENRSRSDSDKKSRSPIRDRKAHGDFRRSTFHTTKAPPVAPVFNFTSALATRTIPQVLPLSTLNRKSIEDFKRSIETLRRAQDLTAREVFIDESIQRLITTVLVSSRAIQKFAKEWQAWTDQVFFENLLKEFPNDKLPKADDEFLTAMARLDGVRLNIDFNVSKSELLYVERIQKILDETKIENKISDNQLAEIVKMLVRNVGRESASRSNPIVLNQLHTYLRSQWIPDIDDFLISITRWVEKVREHWTYGVNALWINPSRIGKDKELAQPPNDPKDPVRNPLKGKFPRKPDLDKATPKDGKPDRRKPCQGCGRPGHTRNECKGKEHPDHNKADCEWGDSDAMKQIRAAGLKDKDNNPLELLPWTSRTDGTPYKLPRWEDTSKKRKRGKHVCTSCSTDDLMVLQRYARVPQEYTTTASLIVAQSNLTINVLFDTGALQGNYLSTGVADWLMRQGADTRQEPSRICSAFNECVITNNIF